MTKNFIDFIIEYTITIPLIQRDYAQGRVEEKNKANNFLDAILEGTQNSLNLDFVYGKTDEEKKEFLPLDGQQRLTTLLLIYWFVSLKDKHIVALEKFNYDVRSSTKDFIKKLTSEECWNKFSKTNIKNSIKNANWFFLSWENDPTVMAILNMLNLIEDKFQGVTLDQLNNITFEVLPLNEFNLTDELYVKMNARGKPLSEFENFKAKLENFLKFTDKEYEQTTKAKLDNDWLNSFWNIAKEKVDNISDAPKLADEMFYNFFYNFTLTLYLINKNKLECNINNKSKLFSIMYDEKEQIGFINQCSLFDFYEDVYNTEDNIKILIEVLNYIADKTNPVTEEFKKFINKKNISYWERARFYALSLGYIHNLNNIEFKRWKRITFNLINNQLIQSPENLINTLKSLEKLSTIYQVENNNIYDYIQNNKDMIEFFHEIQRAEEVIKAKIILNHQENHWENEFLEAENHWYLDGQIGFLLEDSKQNGDYSIDKFVEYRKKFIALWKFAKNNKDNQILLYQALLTKGNYLPKVGNSNNFTFCSFNAESVRIKNDNWKKVFHNDKSNEYLKKLLDDIDLNIYIKSNLENIITQWLSKQSYCDLTNFEEKYRYTIVSNPQTIKYCNNLQIRYKQDGKEVYLLSKNQMNGTHVELYTWKLFIENFPLKNKENRLERWRLESNFECKPFKVVHYHQTSSSEQPCIRFEGWEEYELNIFYNFENERFQIGFYNNNDKTLKKLDQNIKNILIENKFEYKEDIYYENFFNYSNSIYSLCQEDKLVIFLKNLFEKF